MARSSYCFGAWSYCRLGNSFGIRARETRQACNLEIVRWCKIARQMLHEMELEQQHVLRRMQRERFVIGSNGGTGTPILGLTWFNDRARPSPMNPPGRRRSGRVALGPGSAALFIRQRLRAFGCTLNVRRQHVRFGSKADMCSAKRHVRFAPNSGHVRCTTKCPLCANAGHRPLS